MSGTATPTGEVRCPGSTCPKRILLPAQCLEQNNGAHQMSQVEVKVPDIGDFKEVEVIEVMVKVGDTIKVDQSLITVE